MVVRILRLGAMGAVISALLFCGNMGTETVTTTVNVSVDWGADGPPAEGSIDSIRITAVSGSSTWTETFAYSDRDGKLAGLPPNTAVILTIEGINDTGAVVFFGEYSIPSVIDNMKVDVPAEPAEAPGITIQPLPQTVGIGQTAVFMVATVGTHPLEYQWIKGSASVEGATDSILTLADVQNADAGEYFVMVSNRFDTIVSDTVSLTVSEAAVTPDPPAGIIVLDSTTTSITLRWRKVLNAVKYNIYLSTSDTGNFTLNSSTTDTSRVISGLAHSTRYYLRLASVNGTNVSSQSAPVSSKTRTPQGTQPSPPVVSGPALTNDNKPTWTWTGGGNGAGVFRYNLDSVALLDAVPDSSDTFTPSEALAEGTHTLYVQESNSAGDWSLAGSFNVTIDTTPPEAPQVQGASPTSNTQPTWSWSSGGGGNGSYQFKLDSLDFTTGATDTTATTYTPTTALSEGTHTLYVRERDDAGNWSEPGSLEILIDPSVPAAPEVRGVSPTNNTRPTWTWSSAGGNGNYRFRLNSSILSTGSTATTDTFYTPTSALNQGSHTLYVQEQNLAGTWSTSGLYAITIDITAPAAPVVTSVTPTNQQKPTWTWTSGGGGKGLYRYKLDNSSMTGSTTTMDSLFTSAANLPEGTHTLYVQESDAAGNWSPSGEFTIEIDTLAPAAPVVQGTTPTSSLRPTWSWSSGGDGNGSFRYRLDSPDMTTGTTTTTAMTYVPITDLSAGSHTLYVQERDDAGNWSPTGSLAITIDASVPPSPVVTGTSPTNSATPVWEWTSVVGTGEFRYRLNNADLSTGATETSEMTYTPESALAEEAHTLYVQERNSLGTWSGSGQFTITIDLTAPTAPNVTGTTPVNTARPVWNWTPGGGGNGTYRYKLDTADLTAGAIEVTATTFTPAAAISEGAHVLYVQERDVAGNWSLSGSSEIVIDLTAPNAPAVTAPASPTANVRPTWSWMPGGGGNGTFRYKRNDSNLATGAVQTSELMYTPESDLAQGLHTLYVQEQDSAGNWSLSGSGAVTVQALPTVASGVTAVAQSNTSIHISWSAAGGTTSYRLTRATSSGGPFATVNANITATSFTDGSRIAGTAYYYQVISVNSSGEASPSATASAVTWCTPPANVQAAGITRSTIRVTWNAEDASATRYGVFRSLTSGGTYDSVGNSTTTSYTNSGLGSNVTYYYKVKAYNASVASAFSSPYVSAAAPDSVAPLSVTATYGMSVNLSWAASTDPNFTNYKVYYKSTPGVTTSATLGGTVTAKATTTHTVTGLTPNTAYYFKVYATNTSNLQTGSNEVAVQTQIVWRQNGTNPNPLNGAVGTCQNKIYYVGGTEVVGGRPVSLATMKYYDPANGSWTTGTQCSRPRAYAGCVEYNSKLYVFGGSYLNYDQSLNRLEKTIEEYTPATQTWYTRGSALPVGRNIMGLCVLGTKAYLIGGSVAIYADTYTTLCETYDFETGASATIAALPYALERPQATVYDGKVYVFGSYTYSSLFEYNPSTNIWTQKTPLPQQYGARAARVNDNFCILGGISDVNWIDPIATTSLVSLSTAGLPSFAGTNMPVALKESLCAVANNKVYMIGGTNLAREESNTVYEYSPEFDR